MRISRGVGGLCSLTVNIESAAFCVSTASLGADIEFFTKTLGMRLETIFPADDPRVAVLSGHGVRLRLERSTAGEADSRRMRLRVSDLNAIDTRASPFESPGGTRVEVAGPEEFTATETKLVDTRLIISRGSDANAWNEGRAAMLYRDLIPGRLGGAAIASHIRIPNAGPVDDLVHFHDVGFQLIYCLRAWVRVVYEDQGPPFVLAADDCLIQPPRIRHRVLEASEGLEVLEITLPAEHMTTIDHAMALPTASVRRDRAFDGQRFCLSESKNARWCQGRLSGFEWRDTKIEKASAGMAAVRSARFVGGDPERWHHDADFLFGFVLSGTSALEIDGEAPEVIRESDAFVIPRRLNTSFKSCSGDFRFVEIECRASSRALPST